jgi:putative transposase
MTTWLTVGEVANLYNLTERTIRSRISDNTFEGSYQETIGGNNRKAYEINLASLPLPLQQKYYMKSIVKETAEVGRSKAPYTLGELKELHGLAFEKYLAKALHQRSAVLEFMALENGEKAHGVAEICDRYNFSDRALYRYKKEYEKHGLIGLFKKPRKDKGNSTLSADGIRYIRGCFLQPMRPKISHVYKMYIKEAEKQGWKMVSQDTIYREIQRIPDALKCLAREGLKDYNAGYAPQITRSYEDLMVNEYWVGDGHTIALWIPEANNVKRYTFSAWMDMRTKALVGWCIAQNSNSRVIAAALRSGIMRYGLPATCYMDNGKDYKSGHLNADTRDDFTDEYQGIFKMLNIGTKFAIPYNAKAKPIERFFQTFSSELSRYLPGFCGETIEERPHNLNKKELFIKGLSILQVSEAIEGYIEAYNNRPHSALGGKSPIEVMKATPLIRQDTVTEEELDYLMMPAGKAKILASGINKFKTIYWDDALIPYVGRTCTLRYDPNKIGEIYIYMDGRLLCKAKNKELLTMNATEDDVKRWSKLQAQARKATREAIQSYEVTEDEVRRAMLEDYVSDELITSMLTPKNTTPVNKSNVVKMTKSTAKSIEKKTFDEEEKVENRVDMFKQAGEKLLAVK